MTTIGFLACETTLPGKGGGRRGDAFEHDLMIAALNAPFRAAGLELRVIDWEAALSEFEDVSLVMLGTAWNYQDKAEAFLSKLDALEDRGVTVCNSAQIVRWNATKTYLRELEECGAATVPTLWQRDVGQAELLEAFHHFGCDKLVVKRQVGAGALDQVMITRDAVPGEDWTYGHPAMLQPFLPAIATSGELSFIFVEGELSHALRKLPASGDYRIQSLYGGTECVHQPSSDEAEAASAIVAALPFDTPLYARIDMLRSESGQLLVMEAELIEPYLYPQQGPQLGRRLASAISKRISAL